MVGAVRLDPPDPHVMPNENTAEKLLVPPAWLPLGFVIGTLLLMLATPFIIRRAGEGIRHGLNVSGEARMLLSEFEGAFAEELIIVVGETSGDTIEAKRNAAIASERASQRRLDSVAAQLGGEAVERIVSLRTAEQRWRALTAPGTLPPSEQARRERLALGGEVIDAAKSLRGYLVGVSNRTRNETIRLERTDFTASVALAAIALGAMAVVISLDRKVRRYARQADDRTRQLERSVELRATLIHGVVHDVKNPLGAATAYAELLEDGAIAGALNDKQREMITRFTSLVGTALQTVGELVELARVDAGEYTIERRRTNLVSTVREIVEDHRAHAIQKSITLSFTSSTDSLWLNTDQARVRHVVENLLSNALKYTPTNGRVAVAVNVGTDTQSGSHVAISVRDSGPGVPPDLRTRIFDPFYRVPSSERRVSGTGLGLAISHRIAGLLGGTIMVTDAPEGGANFVFSLPVR